MLGLTIQYNTISPINTSKFIFKYIQTLKLIIILGVLDIQHVALNSIRTRPSYQGNNLPWQGHELSMAFSKDSLDTAHHKVKLATRVSRYGYALRTMGHTTYTRILCVFKHFREFGYITLGLGRVCMLNWTRLCHSMIIIILCIHLKNTYEECGWQKQQQQQRQRWWWWCCYSTIFRSYTWCWWWWYKNQSVCLCVAWH